MAWQDNRGVELSISVGGIVVVMLALWCVFAYQCHVRWGASNLESRYTIFGGCLVLTKNGWIPDDRIRELQP